MKRIAWSIGMAVALIAAPAYGDEGKDCSSLQKCAALTDDENRLGLL